MTTTFTRPRVLLSEVLFSTPDRNFGTLAALPSNVQTIESALLFSTGHLQFLAIVGPSGWGKTHLLEAVAARVRRDLGVGPTVESAMEWVCAGGKAETPGPLILDNVQDLLDGPRTRMTLRVILERRLRAARPTLLAFTAAKPTRPVRHLLPNLREWMLATMPAPDPTERALVIDRIATGEGLRLSPVLVRLMATRMKGNGRTLAGALKRLRLQGVDWMDDFQVLRACGTLDPFFADSSDWDLVEAVVRTLDRAIAPNADLDRGGLALHLLLHGAALNESHVARRFGIEPAKAYAAAARFERASRSLGLAAASERLLVHALVDGLSKDQV
ncbi:MAG: hypothetical protein HYR64_02725 [Fimbriimonas ginsengisoli]|uniref:Chromosomal replication initiator protein DnaA domain-containing protein n=1 Tax=Fimbriimonas ginsengisoli TaxID=1005039 RepID=A0A931PVW1_FIMGI|nr:hypothetical protein [Fimbriimonas ginsengisoli]